MTYFEVLVAVAYAAFADLPVDVAVVEVGMGGSWDATNVVDAPSVRRHARSTSTTATSSATRSRRSPARRPASSRPTPSPSCGLQASPDARRGARRPRERGRGPDRASRAPTSASRRETWRSVVSRSRCAGLAAEYPDLFLPLHGTHQAQNAAVAVAAVEAFLGGGETALDVDVLRAGLATVDSPGRLEIVRRSPTVLVDAAHNPAGRAGPARRDPRLVHLRPPRRGRRRDEGQGGGGDPRGSSNRSSTRSS